MKILFIISSLNSGGAERVVSLLANYFIKNHQVTIATFSNNEPFYTLDKNIIHKKLDLLKNSTTTFDKIKNIFYRIKSLKMFFKQENPDIVISFMTHTNILSIIASKLNNQKIIISERIAYDFYNSNILNLIRKCIYPFANTLITQTKADKENYKFLNNVEVIYNPISFIDCDIKKENIILAVGRLDKQKGFDTLIDVFNQIDTNWQLIIAGDGKEKVNLEKLIYKNNIKLIGNQKDIFKWYEKSSIFVLSSKKEGFPNVLLEAMSCGCAVVSFDCPYGPSEIIEHNKNGLLVENQNKEELKKAIELLIKNKSLRDKLSKEAIKVKEKYSIEKIAKEWENIINKVIAK